MKIKNISKRTYQHGIFTIKSGAEISVPDNIGKLLLNTKDFISLEITIDELGPKPDISKIKLEQPKKEVKKSGYTRKSNRKRV